MDYIEYLIEYKKSLDYETPYVFATKYRGQINRRDESSVWLLLKTVGDRAGIKESNPHKYRHTFATTLISNGADVRMVQEMLGHSSISTTQRYTHVTTEKLIEIYKNAHPHGK